LAHFEWPTNGWGYQSKVGYYGGRSSAGRTYPLRTAP